MHSSVHSMTACLSHHVHSLFHSKTTPPTPPTVSIQDPPPGPSLIPPLHVNSMNQHHLPTHAAITPKTGITKYIMWVVQFYARGAFASAAIGWCSSEDKSLLGRVQRGLWAVSAVLHSSVDWPIRCLSRGICCSCCRCGCCFCPTGQSPACFTIRLGTCFLASIPWRQKHFGVAAASNFGIVTPSLLEKQQVFD